MKKIALAVAALAATTMFGLTACGGDDSPTAAAPTTKSDSEVDRMQNFIQCLREHGVDVPDKPGGQQVAPAPGSNAQFDAAQAACAKYAPLEEPAGEDVTAADQDRALRMAECLREQGINAKDPKPGTTTISVEEGAGDTSEKLVAAYTTCNKQVPNSNPPTAPN